MGITDKLRYLLVGGGVNRRGEPTPRARGKHAPGIQPKHVPAADRATWFGEPSPQPDGENAASIDGPEHESPEADASA